MLDQVAALAKRHQLPKAVQEDIAFLVRRALAAGNRSASVLSTLIEPVAAVALNDVTELRENLPGAVPFNDEHTVVPTQGSPARYEDLGLLGTGGMGEVRRVLDRDLNRTMAMKVAHPSLMEKPTHLARFLEEAQATAQLQHPGIVPVHELGRLDDGRFFFTMREVRGRTLGEVIHSVHAVSATTWGTTADGWHMRRLVTTLHQVCSAVAYAHSKGVVHRDLKPENVMIGDYGEALVVDWGLAKVTGQPDRAAEAGDLDVVVTDRSENDAQATRMGTVAGTPAYMPPEQALGEIDRIDARSDVYSLGAMLYEILSGRPPYEGRTGREVLRQVLMGPPGPPGRVERVAGVESMDAGADQGPLLPPELVALCERAMAREPEDRIGSAEALATEVMGWLDGAKRRERALEVLAVADRKLEASTSLRAQAEAAVAEGESLLEGVLSWEPEEAKLPGWTKQDEAKSLAQAADLLELEYRETLRAALNHAPDLPEAHERLADLHQRYHALAEGAGQADTLQWETLLRQHDLAGKHAVYLKGTGALTLVTDPPGAEVLLYRYVPHGRRLVERFERSLGPTPLVEMPLAMGRYLCVLRHPDGGADVRYPVHIARGEAWRGVRPGGKGPHPVHLPRRGELGPDDVYVPAGWFLAGDGAAFGSMPVGTRLWCDPFVIRRFPVTNTEYIAFLDDLVWQGRQVEALRWAPRERGGTVGEQGPAIYGRDADGRFVLRPDVDGDMWGPDWPVMMVDWHCATAYAAWHAARTGQPWRLPWDFEWEKAARGVDGRLFPWGDGLDPSYACCRDSLPGRPLVQVVDTFPLDVSPYGMRGAGGNTRDWCVDHWTKDGALPADRVVRPHEERGEESDRATRVDRGGLWDANAGVMRCSLRNDYDPDYRSFNLGFRLCRSLHLEP